MKMVAPADTVELLGVKVHTLSLAQLLAFIEQTIHQNQRGRITYLNVHGANLAYEQPWLRAFFNQCEVVFCDGFGIKWGARLLGTHIPERYTPPDWIDRLAQLACQQNFSLFLLGNRPGVGAKAAQLLQARFPGLRVIGTQPGYFDQTPGSVENDAVLRAINSARPHILLVSFGMPLQERWLMENWDRLEVNVAMTVGAMFDYLVGETSRGPRWMTDHGLEWLARLFTEPRRLWRRYLVGNPLFVWRLLKQRLGLL